MTVIKAPNPVLLKSDNYNIIFLAGSIEMGAAEDWQDEVSKLIDSNHNTVLNPRRDDWDSSWDQSINCDYFKKQVDWELAGLEKASTVIFYFAENTKSPISLMELGLVSGMNAKNRSNDKKIIVYCHPNFWRLGNIEIICERYGLTFFTDKQEFINYIREDL